MVGWPKTERINMGHLFKLTHYHLMKTKQTRKPNVMDQIF